MNINEIRELIQAVCESGITELEIERTGVKVRIRKDPSSVQSDLPPRTVENFVARTGQPSPEPAVIEPSEGQKTPSSVPGEPDLHLIRSPIVGTFYRAAKPDADPFVQAGDRVESGKILCIIEAMKLMNEIEADADGEIAEIYVDNDEPVEFGQALFGIRRNRQS